MKSIELSRLAWNESSLLRRAPHCTSQLFAQHELNQLSSTRESRGQETERFVLKIVIRDPLTMIEDGGMYFTRNFKNSRFPPSLSASVSLKGKNFLRLTSKLCQVLEDFLTSILLNFRAAFPVAVHRLQPFPFYCQGQKQYFCWVQNRRATELYAAICWYPLTNHITEPLIEWGNMTV